MVSGLKGSLSIAAVSLALGAVAGYFLSPSKSLAGNETLAKKSSKRIEAPKIQDASSNPMIKSLRQRIAYLEKQLAERKDEVVDIPQTNVAKVASETPAAQRHRRNWLEDIKKNDPKRYTQMTNHFAQMHRQRIDRQMRKLAFLESIDTSTMSESAKQTHFALQESMALQEELISRMRELHESGNDNPEARRELANQMRENGELQRELRSKERDNLFEQTATQLGFRGEEAKAIVETIKDVIEATEDPWMHHGGRRGRSQRPSR
jgi:hypothetical protein